MAKLIDPLTSCEVNLSSSGFEVQTEGDLDQALRAALANQDAFSLLNVHLEPDDISPALARLAERMSKQV